MNNAKFFGFDSDSDLDAVRPVPSSPPPGACATAATKAGALAIKSPTSMPQPAVSGWAIPPNSTSRRLRRGPAANERPH